MAIALPGQRFLKLCEHRIQVEPAVAGGAERFPRLGELPGVRDRTGLSILSAYSPDEVRLFIRMLRDVRRLEENEAEDDC